MVAGRVLTEQDLRRRLRDLGYEETTNRTTTGAIWKSKRTGKHIQVPFPYDGMYPNFILRDLEAVIGPLLEPGPFKSPSI